MKESKTKTLTNFEQRMLDEVMDCFDFDKVFKTMQLLQWSWHDVGVPDIYEIKQRARERLKDAITRDSHFSQTGGFKAQYSPEGEWLSLEFILESWEAYEE